MDLEIGFGYRQQSGMEEQGRVSRASSVVTVSSTREKADKKLQSFCKRSRSVQRDPNCAVVIRGWLYKRDSTGLKLWKRRWFVLSNYCLFYYKDSREECVLGSLPLPSYKIFFCSPRECKNRKYAFKVVHQGMRSYLLSADTQEDMLGWVRALSQSACMETDDLINRRCSSYHDFSQIGGSTESVNPLHVYRTQNKPSLHNAGSVDMAHHRGRHRATYSSDIRTRSLSLDCTGEEQLLCQEPGTSTPRNHYESRSRSPLGRVDQQPQEIHSDQLPPLPHSRITHNSPGPLHYSTGSVCVSPSSMYEKETHTLTALQGDTDMVLTCLCGCDKVLQTLSVELDLLQQDKDHAEFALDMSRIELSKGQLNERLKSQKALLQEELVTIRARMCDLSQEMERVWLDYKRMESELCVFRSHLQHICHFGLPQEQSLAQKQIWMMDDILSGLKPNRNRFKALMALHTPTRVGMTDKAAGTTMLEAVVTNLHAGGPGYWSFPHWIKAAVKSGKKPGQPYLVFPLLHNSSLHPEESVHYWGEEFQQPPARPPLPLELDSTKESSKLRPEWAEPNYTPQLLYNPATLNTHSSTHSNTHTAESQSLCLGEEFDHSKEMDWRCDQKKLQNKRNQSPDVQMNTANKPHPLTESSPVCIMHVMRVELPSALTAQRVCLEESKAEKDDLSTLSYKQEEQKDNDNVDVCSANRESNLAMTSEQRHTKHKRVERIRERVLKSALRRSDSAHPLKFVDISGSGSHCQRSTDSVNTDKFGIHPNKAPLSLSDIKPSSTNHISTLTINNMASEETNQSVNTSTNQRAEWFLSTNHWQEFIPLNIQEEELSPNNQNSEKSANQNSELSTNQTHFKGKLEMSTSLGATETPNQNTPKPSDPPLHRPIGSSSDSHMILHSDHSGRELCIYEEIQCKAPKSAIVDNGNVVGRARNQQSNLSTSHNADSHLSVNQHVLLEDAGRENGATREEEAAQETGTDNIASTKIRQPVYNCWNKNSLTNPSDSFVKPRVTVVSTSL